MEHTVEEPVVGIRAVEEADKELAEVVGTGVAAGRLALEAAGTEVVEAEVEEVDKPVEEELLDIVVVVGTIQPVDNLLVVGRIE